MDVHAKFYLKLFDFSKFICYTFFIKDSYTPGAKSPPLVNTATLFGLRDAARMAVSAQPWHMETQI
jgi:hypothetical protein